MRVGCAILMTCMYEYDYNYCHFSGQKNAQPCCLRQLGLLIFLARESTDFNRNDILDSEHTDPLAST